MRSTVRSPNICPEMIKQGQLQRRLSSADLECTAISCGRPKSGAQLEQLNVDLPYAFHFLYRFDENTNAKIMHQSMLLIYFEVKHHVHCAT